MNMHVLMRVAGGVMVLVLLGGRPVLAAETPAKAAADVRLPVALNEGKGKAEEAAGPNNPHRRVGEAMQPRIATANPVLNVKAAGAKGDGKADDTAVFQKLLDLAAESQATVEVPPGTYCVGRLKVQSHTGITGSPASRTMCWIAARSKN
jgi:hypothetical protein